MKNVFKNNLLIIVLYLSFISLGLPDQILGVAWPTMRMEFSKSLGYAGLIVLLVTVFSAISSYFGGYFLKKFKLSNILIASGFLTAAGLLGYGLSPAWWMLLLFTLPLGFGAGAIDVALNNYVATNFSSKHMNWLHGCWGIGASLGPAIMTSVIVLKMTWRAGYTVIALIQFFLVLIFIFTQKIWCNSNSETKIETKVKKQNIISLDTFLSSAFFFIYVAVEGCIGLWFYSILIEHRQTSVGLAGTFIVIYWSSLTVGRFIIGAILKYIEAKNIITYGIIFAVISMFLLIPHSSGLSVFALCLAGLGLSGIYPCMMSETPKRFNEEISAILMGHQVGSTYLGFATLVPLVGVLIQKLGLHCLIPILIILLMSLFMIDRRLRRL